MSTIAYAAVNVSERQADLAAKVKKLQRRKKRDKESSDAFTTSTRDDNDDDDDSLDEEEQEMKNKGLLRKAGAVTAAIATAGMNIFSIFSFGGSLIYAAGGVATVVSTTVATREVSLENVESKWGTFYFNVCQSFFQLLCSLQNEIECDLPLDGSCFRIFIAVCFS